MTYRLSRHAESEMERRQILKSWLDRLLDAPEQRIQQSDDTEVLQSRFATEDGKIYLLRAVVTTGKDPAVVITVYRTSKIDKYWRPE
jgi:hypothetical protein